MPVTTTIDRAKTDINIPFGLKTYGQMMVDIRKSEKQYSRGEYRDAKEVARELCSLHGV